MKIKYNFQIAKQWYEKNKRTMHKDEFSEEQIAVAAFLAGCEAASAAQKEADDCVKIFEKRNAAQ